MSSWTKGQVWSIDLVAGISLFSLMIIVYFIFVSNLTSTDVSAVSELAQDANTISSSLLLAGTPVNWSMGNIIEIGLTNEDFRLDEDKLRNALAVDYSQMKLLLKTRFDFLIFFEDKENNVISFPNGLGSFFSYVGKLGVTKENIKEDEDPVALVASKRFIIYNSEIVTMVVYVWQ